jgi:hypothetical protein
MYLLAWVDPDDEDSAVFKMSVTACPKTVSHLRRLISLRQYVIIMQVVLEDYIHMDMIPHWLVICCQCLKGPAASVFRAVQEE